MSVSLYRASSCHWEAQTLALVLAADTPGALLTLPRRVGARELRESVLEWALSTDRIGVDLSHLRVFFSETGRSRANSLAKCVRGHAQAAGARGPHGGPSA
eukprot:15440519-Alexandrium_andersonii.AAC.1